MATISIVKNILTDNSVTFDLFIQHGGESVTLELNCGSDEEKACLLVNGIHDAMETAMGTEIDWANTLTNRG